MHENEWNEWVVTAEEAGERLDKVLAARYREVYSRTYFQHLIEQKAVLVNGEPAKKRTKLAAGDELEVCFLVTAELDLVAENIPLDIVYEDEHLLIVNKPAGLVVHPAPGNWSGTFVHALLFHCQQLAAEESGSLRPGIVHRLDKDTSGLLLAAKNSLTQQRLIEMFSQRLVHKEYIAICVGNPGNGEIKQPIGRHPTQRKKMCVREDGRYAHSRCLVLASDGKLSLVHVVIETGRTHQIRVHLQHAQAPVLGDAVYGSVSANQRYKTPRQLLHAHLLRFIHPITGQNIEVKASLPADMQAIAQRLYPKGGF